MSTDRELIAALLKDIDNLIDESEGVTGLHLNGDVAPWDELLPGGRFERFTSMAETRARLAEDPAQAGPTEDDIDELCDLFNCDSYAKPAIRRALELWGHQPPQPTPPPAAKEVMEPTDSELLNFLLTMLFRSHNLHMDNTKEFFVNNRSAGWPFTGRAKTAKDFVRAAYIRAAEVEGGQ